MVFYETGDDILLNTGWYSSRNKAKQRLQEPFPNYGRTSCKI